MEPIHTHHNSPPSASGAIPGLSLARITIVYHSYSTHQTPLTTHGAPLTPHGAPLTPHGAPLTPHGPPL